MGAEAPPRRGQQAGRPAGGLTGPPELTLRHVVAGDAARLRALRLEALAADPDAFGSTLARDGAREDAWWAAWCAASAAGTAQRTFVLADRDGTWRGLALVRALEGDRAELLSMWVAPAARGRGGVRLLCDAGAAWAAEHGCTALALAVFATNARALRAYEKCGFSVVDRAWIVTDDGRRLDELRMERALA